MSENPESFTIMLTLGNDAMQTPEDVADLLEQITRYMRKHGSWPDQKLHDVNGNTVGKVFVT